MPRSASVGGLAKRGVIPRKKFYIKLFFFNTVILVLKPAEKRSSTLPKRNACWQRVRTRPSRSGMAPVSAARQIRSVQIPAQTNPASRIAMNKKYALSMIAAVVSANEMVLDAGAGDAGNGASAV